MTKYDIITVPDPVLKKEAQPVETVDDGIRTQLDAMYQTMREAPGIGLAANQVGLLNRVFVMHVEPENRRARKYEDEENQDTGPVFLINPQIIWTSEETSVLEEGCLSIPGQYAEVERPASVRVKYVDYHGKEQEMAGNGLVSHVIQHELDHLNGVLFIDYLSRLKRNMMVKRVRKLLKDAGGQDRAKI